MYLKGAPLGFSKSKSRPTGITCSIQRLPSVLSSLQSQNCALRKQPRAKASWKVANLQEGCFHVMREDGANALGCAGT